MIIQLPFDILQLQTEVVKVESSLLTAEESGRITDGKTEII